MAITTSPSWSSPHFHSLSSDKLTLCKTLHFLSPPCPYPTTSAMAVSSSASPLTLTRQQQQNDEDEEEGNELKVLRIGELSYDDDDHEGSLKSSNELKIEEDSGFRLRESNLKLILNSLVRAKKWDSLYLISEDLKKYKVFPDPKFCATLISTCIRAKKFKLVTMLLEAFESDQNVAVSGYISALKGYNKLHMYRCTIEVYHKLKSSKISLNDASGYCHIMEAYLKTRSNDKVIELFYELDGANKLDSTRNSIPVYELFIKALGKSGRAWESLECVGRMEKKGIEPNESVYATLIDSFVAKMEVEIVEEIVENAQAKRMLKDPALFLKLVVMYVKKGMVERTLNVVKVMKNANLRVSDCVFSTIINGFVKKRGLKAAAGVYRELISLGCEPGQVSFTLMINVYSRLGLYSDAQCVFNEMVEKGFDKCVVAYSTVIVMYGKIGKVGEAMKLFARMKANGCRPNLWIYNALMDMQGRAKNLGQVERIWREMKRTKTKPDKISYTCVISAYCRAKEYEMCIQFYDEYRRNEGQLDRAMAGVMVSVLSKTNRVDELLKLLQDLKAEGSRLDMRLYRSALNALRDAGLLVQDRWLQESFDITLVANGKAEKETSFTPRNKIY